MKKYIMYFNKTSGEQLDKKKFSFLDLGIAAVVTALSILLIKESLTAGVILLLFTAFFLVKAIYGSHKGKCPCCGNSLSVNASRKERVLFCEKCCNVLYKRDEYLYKLDSKENTKIKLLRIRSISRAVVLLIYVELIAYSILMALGFDKAFILKIDYINILPVTVLLFTLVYTLILSRRIEVKESTEESQNGIN